MRAADKNIASSMELIKAAKADLKPKLSGDANFQYTGNPIELTVNLPQSNPLTFEGRDMKYGASLSLMQPSTPADASANPSGWQSTNNP